MFKRTTYDGTLYRVTMRFPDELYHCDWQKNLFKMYDFVRQVNKHRGDGIHWQIETSEDYGDTVDIVSQGHF